MKFITKPVAYAIWVGAIVISVALAWEFQDKQFSIGFAIACLALAVSSFGLLFSRDAWGKNARPEFVAGVLLWVVGAIFFAITEWGYWDSSYGQRFTEYQQASKARQRVENLKDRKWKALTTGEIPVTPAQIEAQLNAAKMNDRWQGTKQCTDATNKDSKDFCKGYFDLQGKLADAQARINLENQFSAAATETKGSLVHNLLAGADVIARRLKIDDRLAADIVIFAAWILLLLARDLGALVADPVGTRRKPVEAPNAKIKAMWADYQGILAEKARIESGRAEASPATSAPKIEERGSTLALATPETAFARPAPDPEPTPVTPPAPISPAPATEEAPIPVIAPSSKVGQPEAVRLVVDNEFFDPESGQKSNHRLTKKKEKRLEGNVMRWISECTSQTPDKRVKATSQECRRSYVAWCRLNGFEEIGHKKMSRIMGAKLRNDDAGSRGPRNGKGAVWPGLIVFTPSAVPLRARA